MAELSAIRVFPRRTSYTPTDSMVYIGMPDMLVPDHREVHVSCTFTWDKPYCERLVEEWKAHTDKPVKLGGPAYGSSVEDEFIPGMYVKDGITFTSRGCNNVCPWCCVPKTEGRLREIPITEGNIIQDNNFLQTSRQHKDKVFEMLKGQRGICFKGGLECDLVDDHFVDGVRGLRISELWLACDTDGMLIVFKRACEKLVKAGFSRDKIRCYSLIGRNGIDRDEARLREIWNAGAMPSAQLYRDFTEVKTDYDLDYKRFERMWQRPAAMSAHMKRGTDFRDYGT